MAPHLDHPHRQDPKDPTHPWVGRFARARLQSTLELRPSGFLFDIRTAESYTVNPTGACLVRALQQGVEPGALWQKLVAAFEVSELDAQRDVLRFFEDLNQLGLLRDGTQEARATAEPENDPDREAAEK